ncbi:MAG: hypothetical protein OXF68_02115 [Gammaproteobacteria bacterium]|nr:hypothetical protein [Gammaproteobacteria bacterium]
MTALGNSWQAAPLWVIRPVRRVQLLPGVAEKVGVGCGGELDCGAVSHLCSPLSADLGHLRIADFQL